MTTLRQKENRARWIVHELSRMSKNGWRDARPEEYKPLEAEYAELHAEIHAARQKAREKANVKKILAMAKRAWR